MDISQRHEFRPMLTDVGLCHVHNGNTISQTYVSGGRNEDLKWSFEQFSGDFKPAMINGTASQRRKTFWFDVGIR